MLTVRVVGTVAKDWAMEGKSGTSRQVQCISNIDGAAVVFRVKLPKEVKTPEPGDYQINPRAYVDGEGRLAFGVGSFEPLGVKKAA